MTNVVAGSTQGLPNTGAAVSGGAVQPTGLPAVAGGATPATGQALVAGDPAATTAALTPQAATTDPAMTSIVDAALAEQSATVTGGGAPGVGLPGPSADPRGGIPEFVRRFLPEGEPQSQAAAGAYGPPSKAPQQGVQQGWAWIGCCPNVPTQAPTPEPEAPIGPPDKGEPSEPVPPPTDEMPPPPGKGEMPPPPGKGEMPPPPGKGEMPPPPGKGEMPPPPGKGEPPSKTPPPVKPTKPEQVDEPKQRYTTYTVKPGDWLSKIAPKFGITWQELWKANKDQIKDPDLIYPGQVLKVPLPDKPDRPSGPPKPPSKPPSKPPTKPGTPSDPPTKPPSEPPTTKPPGSKPPVDEPPVVEPPDGPPGSDPGRDGLNPEPPPVPDTDGLPPSLPPGL